jgi:hypothetical protein
MPPLASASDYACISGWNLSAGITKRRAQLIAVAQSARKTLMASGRMPQPGECEPMLIAHFHGSAAFAALMQDGQVMNDFILRDMLAGSLARILLDEEWTEISR